MLNQVEHNIDSQFRLNLLLSKICGSLLPISHHATVLSNCIEQFGGRPLLPTESLGLRRPSLHIDGTPIQLSASLLTQGTGGVRVAIEPGSMADPVSKQIEFTLEQVDLLLVELGWQSCRSTVSAITEGILPLDLKETDSWWGGIWTGFVAHPEYFGLRLYFNLRFGDVLSRWKRIGRVFSSLSGEPVCPALKEIILCSSEISVPVGLGLDIVTGFPRSLKVYCGVDAPQQELLSLAPPMVGLVARDALVDLLHSLQLSCGDCLPHQSVTVSYEVPLDKFGIPQSYIKRFKVDADVTRILPGDIDALRLIYRLAAQAGLPTRDLEMLMKIIGREKDEGRLFQYVGLGLADQVTNMNIYIRPPGFSPNLCLPKEM